MAKVNSHGLAVSALSRARAASTLCFCRKNPSFTKRILVPKQGVGRQGGEKPQSQEWGRNIHAHEINYINGKNSGYFKVNA